MSKANPTRPHPPEDEARTGDATQDLAGTKGPRLKDPRSQSAMDNIGVDTPGDLLDEELDDKPGDRDQRGRSFADDVRSDDQDAGIREQGDT